MEGEVKTTLFSSSGERVRLKMDSENMVQDWIMMATPVPMLLILLLYGLMLTVGPRLMASREPYKLKSVMRFYNIFQVAHNMYMVYSFVETPQSLPYIIDRTCSFVDFEDEDVSTLYKAYLYYSWNYLISKHIDLLDTVFIVLRKKNSHITFLHVYHHVAMVFFTWLTINNSVNHHAVIPGAINVIVHSIMYSYYFLATFNTFKRFLWWKHHLTKLQLGQFVVILLYICLVYYYGCPISPTFTFTWTFNVFVILVLFVNFYFKSYIIKSGHGVRKEANDGEKKSL